MTKVITGLSTSLDGFIAGADDSPAQPLGAGGERLFDWFRDGGTPSRFYGWMRMSAPSAEFFDNHAGRVGAIIMSLRSSRQASRRTRSSATASTKRFRRPGRLPRARM